MESGNTRAQHNSTHQPRMPMNLLGGLVLRLHHCHQALCTSTRDRSDCLEPLAHHRTDGICTKLSGGQSRLITAHTGRKAGAHSFSDSCLPILRRRLRPGESQLSFISAPLMAAFRTLIPF